MLKRLFSQQNLNKEERHRFIPFVNERNFMGTLISDEEGSLNRRRRGNEDRNLEMIQNLTKTTKQYLFDKKYKKMARKLRQIEESMHHKEADYDQEVDHCFQTLTASGFGRPQAGQLKHYVDFKSQLSKRMEGIRNSLITKIRTKKQTQQQIRCKTQQLSERFEQQQRLRETKNSLSKKQSRGDDDLKVKKSIFQEIGNKSQFMADVTNSGIKYRQLVQTKKINPWRRWYTKEEVQLFPGSKIVVTKLQKSIY